MPGTYPLIYQGWIWVRVVDSPYVVSPIQVGDSEALLAQSFTIMIQLAHLVGIICDTERRSQ